MASGPGIGAAPTLYVMYFWTAGFRWKECQSGSAMMMPEISPSDCSMRPCRSLIGSLLPPPSHWKPAPRVTTLFEFQFDALVRRFATRSSRRMRSAMRTRFRVACRIFSGASAFASTCVGTKPPSANSTVENGVFERRGLTSGTCAPPAPMMGSTSWKASLSEKIQYLSDCLFTSTGGEPMSAIGLKFR